MQPVLLQRERLGEFENTPGGSICARIASHAASAPGSPAVGDGQSQLSYAELDRRSNLLAAQLRDSGAGPEVCVGLLLDRSVDFVVAALGVLKSGAAYLPLDASTPADRVSFILNDSGSPLLLTHRDKSRNLPAGSWRVVDIDSLESAEPSEPVQVDSDPSSLAYIVYTSGSMGRPKGVEITHGNLCNLIDWHNGAFGVTARDRASQVAGLGFDAAGWEIWPYLTAGASLHFAAEHVRRSPQALRDWLVSEKITISFVPTVLAEQLLNSSWPAETALRTLLTGADTLHRRPVTGLPFVLVNNYGPTECTVVATSGVVTPEQESSGTPSIGRPISDTVALILDEALRPVADGEAGELCLAGSLVGRGYRNLPEMTASRFVTYSPPSGSPMRIYRTGDRARLLPNGEIAFLGRLDDQVKIRGYRIELGEIVACLDRCSGIEASAVVVSDAGDGGPSLVAYVVLARGVQLSASDLREFLSARLPDYMIPPFFVSIAELPVTVNGKLDKSALPAATAENILPNRAQPEASAPAAGLEQQIAGLVASLLGQPSIGTQENFFMAGGHSMFGVQLVARIRDTFGVKLTLRQLFGAPTVVALSTEVAKLTAAAR